MREVDAATIRRIFTHYRTSFGHTEGQPIETACFILGSGRDADTFSFSEVVEMLKELQIAAQLGGLSVCQKSVLHQLNSANIVVAFAEVAKLEEGLLEEKALINSTRT